MHILMLIYRYWPDQAGGTEGQCRRLAQSLSRAGVRVTVVTGRTSPLQAAREDDGCVEVVRVPLAETCLRRPGALRGGGAAGAGVPRPGSSGPSRAQAFAAQLMRAANILMFMRGARSYALRQRAFDLIHVHTSVWIAGFAADLGRRLGVPVLCKESTFPSLPRTPPFVPWRRHWNRLRLGNWFVALHGAAADDLAGKGVRRERISVIPNGVEMPDISRRNEDPALVLFVGNLTQGIADKGIDTMLAAWGAVARSVPGARLAVAGAGDPADVRRLAGEAGAADNVQFLGHVADMVPLYEKAAVVLVPSRREGISNVLLEAQAWGIPVVATDIPGNRAVVVDGDTGILVPAGDGPAMAAAILRLLGDSAARGRMGEAARRHMAANFHIDGIAARIRKLYERILEESA